MFRCVGSLEGKTYAWFACLSISSTTAVTDAEHRLRNGTKQRLPRRPLKRSSPMIGSAEPKDTRKRGRFWIYAFSKRSFLNCCLFSLTKIPSVCPCLTIPRRRPCATFICLLKRIAFVISINWMFAALRSKDRYTWICSQCINNFLS